MDEKYSVHFAHILSTATILSCVFLKVPQIMSVRKRRSAEGVYIQALIMEITGFSIMTMYNFTNDYNIMTYLEYPIILLQIYVLFFYVLKYNRQLHQPIVHIATFTYVGLVLAFGLGFLPKGILGYLVPFCTPLSGFAKVTYIYGIIKAANADAVSLATWVISVGTNLARIFTVYMDSRDMKLITNFAISTSLSFAVLVTAVYYQHFYEAPTPPGRPRKTTPSYRRHSHCD